MDESGVKLNTRGHARDHRVVGGAQLSKVTSQGGGQSFRGKEDERDGQ